MWLQAVASRLKTSLNSRGGRIEWIGAILALPFAYAALRLLISLFDDMFTSHSPLTLGTAHLISGTFFTAGIALGIYSCAWAFAATERHQQLAAYSAVLDAVACLSLAVVIEWYFYQSMPRVDTLAPFLIPASLWVIATIMLLPAAKAKKQANVEAESEEEGVMCDE